jgi:hypothetical protein
LPNLKLRIDLLTQCLSSHFLPRVGHNNRLRRNFDPVHRLRWEIIPSKFDFLKQALITMNGLPKAGPAIPLMNLIESHLNRMVPIIRRVCGEAGGQFPNCSAIRDEFATHLGGQVVSRSA